MAKLTLSDIGSLQNETTAISTINANNALIETAIENTVSRDGTVPNVMNASFDMNSNRILNLPLPVNLTEPARLQDVGDAPGYATAAAASAATAATNAASTAADVTTTNANVVSASAQATNAANSATQAQGYVTGLSGTSTTSLAIGTGSKSFTANTGKLWVAGQFLTASSNANSANYMHGSVTSYNSGSGALVLNVLDIGGSGTLADWNITVSGTQGPQGIQGPTGPSGALGVSGTPAVNQFGTWVNSTTMQGVSITGLVKGNGASAPTAAVASTDYAPATTGTSILKASAGGFANAVAGTDYVAATTGSAIQKANGSGGLTAAVSNTDYLPVASPVMTTPTLGVASATSINKMAITAPTTSSTLAVADGKTATVSNTLTFSGTDSSTLNVGVGGTLTGSSSAAVWYDNIPQNSKSVAYTTVLSDANKHILHPSADTTARVFTIDSNANVAYPVGTAITFVNQNAGGVVTISITTDTMRLAGPGTTGSRTLAANGIATALKITSTEWIISGTGLT